MTGALSFLMDLLTSETSSARERAVASPRPYYGTPTPLHRKARIEQEVLMVAPRFSDRSGVYYDEDHSDWLLIPKYPLPERWHDRWCQLLIVFPPTYPVSAPLGFYLNKKFRLVGGGRDPHFIGNAAHGADNLTRQGWYWYCVQTASGAGGWRPSASFHEPDNLWTFLTLVRDVLTNDN